MKRRRVYALLLLLIVTAFGVWVEPTRVAWGWLRGEAFYDGRPTSWWENDLAARKMNLYYLGYGFPGMPQPADGDAELEKHGTAAFTRTTTPWTEKLRAWLRLAQNDERQPPKLLRGDPAAIPVLNELRDHPQPDIQRMVRYGFRQIEERRGPVELQGKP